MSIQPATEPKTNEVKSEVDHHESLHEKQASLPVDGDLGAQWLANYAGEKREITDEDNRRVRNRVGAVFTTAIERD
jgi:hypothetical protein